MHSVSVRVPDFVPPAVMQKLSTMRTVVHEGITYISTRGGERITAKTDSFGHAVAVYNKKGRRTDSSTS